MEKYYQPIIGLEIHLRLKTQSKLFCRCKNEDTPQPNVNICPICLGHPGTLPFLNNEAVRLGSLFAAALGCRLNETIAFDRKHYFYPDLPKGYQITQQAQPIGKDGVLIIFPDDVHGVNVEIERLHIEEDAAKLKHNALGETLVDFNRAGCPLAEIVTRPVIGSPEEAKIFLQELQRIGRAIGASDANMEKGELRCDANISLQPLGDDTLYPKTEVKNMNSFRSVERALTYEIQRQTTLWNDGHAPEERTTRGWDDQRAVTIEQRAKEDMADYRYLPEPDIPPLVRTSAELELLRASLPELPARRRARLQEEYALNYRDSMTLTNDPHVAAFFEETMSELRAWLDALEDAEGSDEERWKQYRAKLGRLTAGWMTTEIFGALSKRGKDFRDFQVSPENIAELLTMVYERRVNSTGAQKILWTMMDTGGDPSQILATQNLEQTSDEEAIGSVVDAVIAQNPQTVAEIKAGKEKALMFLVGRVMKESKGKVNPEVATKLLKERLHSVSDTWVSDISIVDNG